MSIKDYKTKIGTLIQENRQARGMTQAELAKALGTSQSAITVLKKVVKIISLEMLARISEVLSRGIVSLNKTGKIDLKLMVVKNFLEVSK